MIAFVKLIGLTFDTGIYSAPLYIYVPILLLSSHKEYK